MTLRSTLAIGLFLALFGSAHGQTLVLPTPTATYDEIGNHPATSLAKASLSNARADRIRTLGEDAIRDVKKLPTVLPVLVQALMDPDSETRLAAVKAIHASARKIDRLSYWNLNTPAWESLEPHFRAAAGSLRSLEVHTRVERQVDLLLSRKDREREMVRAAKIAETTPPPTPEPALDGAALRLIEEFRGLRDDQIVEMCFLAKSKIPGFSEDVQRLIFAELLKTTNPRWFEFTLMISDRFDDSIINAVLDSTDPANSHAAVSHPASGGVDVLVLSSATPQSYNVRSRLTELATRWDRSDVDRGLALNALANSKTLEADLLTALVDAYLSNPETDRWSDFYQVLIEHKKVLSAASLNEVVAFMTKTIENQSLETWRRTEAVYAISELAPGHAQTLATLKNVLSREGSSNEELLREILSSLAMHGQGCSHLSQELVELSHVSDTSVRECAIEALSGVKHLHRNVLEVLVARSASGEESHGVKEGIAKTLKANSELSGDVLRHAIHREIQIPQSKESLTELLQTVGRMGIRSEGIDVLCSHIAKDQSRPLPERVAAIQTRGVCAADTRDVLVELEAIVRSDESQVELKASALQAIASIAGAQAIPLLAEFANNENELIACAARHGYHLAGESNTAVHLLLSMLPRSSLASTVELLVQEIGADGTKAFYEVLDSPSAPKMQKEIAFGVLAGQPGADWKRIVSFLKDKEQADAFERSLRESWNFDLDIIPALFEQIEQSPLTSSVAQRAWRIADDFTSGLGAGDDELEANEGAMQRAIVLSARIAPAAAPSAPIVVESSPSTSSPSEDALGAVAVAPAPVPLAPAIPVQADVLADAEIAKSVEVFYGTNRQPLFTSTFGNRLRWGAFGLALLSIIICMYGFAYQRLVSYTFAAMFGLLGLAMVARDSLDISFWFPEHAKTYNGNYSEEIKLGVCKVTIPKSHISGQLESPSLFLRWEVRPDPSKHIVLSETIPLSEQDFFAQMRQTMDKEGKNLLVFIHGYNVSFEDAARRTAQMSYDLKFEGAPVFYSWPSYSDWYRYPDDAENIGRSVGQIKSFLEKLAKDSGAETINIVAHSMGNVGLTQALAQLESNQPLFNQVVLAAPDIDAEVFRTDIAPRLGGKAKRVTLYTSQTDLALLASRYFNSSKRVGDSSYGVGVFPGIETIDATSIDSSLLGHSYYGSVNVLEDIANLFGNVPLSERTYLEQAASANPPYWSFSPAARTAAQQPAGDVNRVQR